jgi:signal transduction histidine kinase
MNDATRAEPFEASEGRPALHLYGLAAASPDRAIRGFLQLAAQACQAPIAALSLKDGAREYGEASIGAGADAVSVDDMMAIHHAIGATDIIIPDMNLDSRLGRHSEVGSDVRFVVAVPVRTDRGLTGLLTVADVAPRRGDSTLLSLLSVLARQLEQHLEDRRATLQREALLVAIIHDMKNPLAALRLDAELSLREPAIAAPLQEILLEMAELTRRMERILHDARDVAAGQQRLSMRSVKAELESIVEKVSQGAARRLAITGIQLSRQVEPVKAVVFIDRGVLERVLESLVDLAIARTPANGAVSVQVSTGEGALECVVTDRGPHIPEPTRKSFFTAELGSESVPVAVPAHRFALGFCRLAVDAMGGRIWVEDAPGSATNFRVRLPLSSLPASRPAPRQH